MNQRDLDDMMRRAGITVGPEPVPWWRRLLERFTHRSRLDERIRDAYRHERKP